MKKTRLIALALIVAMTLMGAGYAYWAETLVIENAINTGNFDVKFGCVEHSDYDNYYSTGDAFVDDESDDDYVNGKNIGTTVTRSNNGNTLTFTNNNIYPGSGAWLKFRIYNHGSIPAAIENIQGVINSGKELKDEFRYTIGSIKIYRTIRDSDNDTTSDSLVQTIHTSSGNNSFNTFDEFITALNNKLKYYPDDSTRIVLQPGEYIEINNDANGMKTGYDIYLRTDVGNFASDGVTPTESATFSFDLNLIYAQWNYPSN